MAKSDELAVDSPYGVTPTLIAELCDRAPDAICLIEARTGDDDYTFKYVNHAFERIYLCDRAQILGTAATPFMRARSGEADFRRVNKALAAKEPFRIRRGFERPDGTFVWLEVNFQPIPWDLGCRWMFISRDVTREKLQHDRMVQLTTAVEQGNDPVFIGSPSEVTGKWKFDYINDAFTRVTGYLPQEIIGHTWDVLGPDPADLVRLIDIRAALFSGQQVRTELSFRHKDGHAGLFELQIQPIRDPASGAHTSVVSVLRDITAIRQREQVLMYEAEHDLLTGLYNRRYLERMLWTAISMTRSKPMHVLIFADLDGFKEVNDRLGHDVGDDVLIAAARAFEGAVFQTDTLARWGGDEFAALLFHCTLENAVRTAEEMVAALARSPDRHGVTVSIGIVAVQPAQPLAELLRRADRVCYEAKAAGRNRILCELM